MTVKDYLSYDPLTGKFTWIKSTTPRVKVGQNAGSINKCSGYVELRLHGQHYYGHRLAWYFVHGYSPYITDHINQNRADNRIANLREVTNSGNNKNCGISKNNTSGAVGVAQLPTGNWRANITVNYKSIHLGMFKTMEEAITARAIAKQKYSFHRNHK